jgi:hypothetical protein
VDRTLADTFDADGADSDEENDGDDRQRLMRGAQASPSAERSPSLAAADAPPPSLERRPTVLPVFAPRSTRIYGGGSGSDGVFANLAAKPDAGEKMEEHPPVSLLSLTSVYHAYIIRPTSKQQQMPLPRTGRPPSSRPAWAAQMRCTSTASPSALSSPSSGTA